MVDSYVAYWLGMILSSAILIPFQRMGTELAMRMEERERLSLRSSMIKVGTKYFYDQISNILFRLLRGCPNSPLNCPHLHPWLSSLSTSSVIVVRNKAIVRVFLKIVTFIHFIVRNEAIVRDLRPSGFSWCPGMLFEQGRVPASHRWWWWLKNCGLKLCQLGTCVLKYWLKLKTYLMWTNVKPHLACFNWF